MAFDLEFLLAAGPWLAVAALVAGQLWMLVVPLALYRRRTRRWPALPSTRRLLVEGLLAVPVLLGMWILIALVSLVLARLGQGAAANPLAGAAREWDPAPWVTLLVVAATLGPVAEETLFRGVLFNALRRWVPWWAAVAGQAVVFGVLHSYGGPYPVFAGCMGLVLGCLYAWRRTLVTSILLHMLQNAAAAAVTVLLMTGPTPALGVGGEPGPDGVVVTAVAPGSAAEEAGLRTGDVITTVDGHQVRSIREVALWVRQHRVGETAVVTFERGNEVRTVEAVLQPMTR